MQKQVDQIWIFPTIIDALSSMSDDEENVLPVEWLCSFHGADHKVVRFGLFVTFKVYVYYSVVWKFLA
jgi:hypothetical protein